jgi:hypothetical protein
MSFASSLTMALYSFAMMAFIAILCAGIIKLIVAVLARSTRATPAVASPPPVAAPPVSATAGPLAAEVSDELAVLIAAACSAVVGAHRIVFVAETQRGANWTTEMRARHHQSHLPHR